MFFNSTLSLNLTGLTLTALTLASTPSFAQVQVPVGLPLAQSQAIVRLKDNRLLAIDPSAGSFVDAAQNAKFDFTVYYYEQQIAPGKIIAQGSNFLFMEDGRFFTTNVSGKIEPKGVKSFRPAAVGATWFSKGTPAGEMGEIVTVDQKGYFYEKGVKLPPVNVVGGNFFITKTGKLNTITAEGYLYSNVDCGGCGLDLVTKAGGSYFVTPTEKAPSNVAVNDKIVALSSENGLPYPPYTVSGTVTKLGGNFFITSKNMLYGISRQGWAQKPVAVSKPILAVGYSMVVFADNTFLVVDSDGIAHSEMIRTTPEGKWIVQKSFNMSLVDSLKPTFLNP